MFQKFKKPILVLMLVGILIPSFYLLSVRKAEASDLGAGWANFFQVQLRDWVLKPLLRQIAQRLLNTYVTKMVDKINGSGRTRNTPSFVDNWRDFLTAAQYRGEDVFRNILANTTLCDHTRQGLQQTFRSPQNPSALPLNSMRVNNLDPYISRARCTMPKGWLLKDFELDFSRGGGWNALVRLNQPQNNSYGSLLMSLGEVAAQRAVDETTDHAEVVAGGGFMGTRAGCSAAPAGQCTTANGSFGSGISCNTDSECLAKGFTACTGGGPSQARCTILGQTMTPAKVLGEASAKFIDSKLQWVISSQDVVSVILNAADSIINNLIQFRKPSKITEPRNSGGPSDDYNSCIKKCAGKSGNSYRTCMQDCANKLENTTPSDYDMTTPPTNNPTPTQSTPPSTLPASTAAVTLCSDAGSPGPTNVCLTAQWFRMGQEPTGLCADSNCIVLNHHIFDGSTDANIYENGAVLIPLLGVPNYTQGTNVRKCGGDGAIVYGLATNATPGLTFTLNVPTGGSGSCPVPSGGGGGGGGGGGPPAI